MTQKRPEVAHRPHVLHVFPSFCHGGYPIRMTAVLNHMGDGLDHTIIALDGRYEARSRIERHVRWREYETGALPVNIVQRLLRIRRIQTDIRPSVMMTYNWGAIEWALARMRHAVSRHIHLESGFGPEEADGQIRRRQVLRKVALRGASDVVVPSKVLLEIAQFAWSVRPRQLKYIPNGVDCDRFSPAVRPDPRFSGLRTRWRRIVGSVAPLRAEKNLSRLLGAFARMTSRTGSVLVIAGDGPDKVRLLEQAKCLGIVEQTVFLGHIENVERLLPILDVFAITSDTEQMPNSLLQAMASQLAVAAVDVGDVKWMLSRRNEPFVVEKHDCGGLTAALDRLLADPHHRAEVALGNRRRAVQSFGLSGMLAAYENMLVPELPVSS